MYWPGLDGVRAIAVAAVVAYHMEPGRFGGGFLGVDVFFVISGYLITSLLTQEWRQTGGIRLVPFWLRRVRRLYPAMLTLLLVVVVVAGIVAPGALALSRSTVPAALVYLTNWWFVLRPVPYFQATGRPPLLIHFWSLAIEEQYYLLWPPILALLLAKWRRPARVAGLALAGAATSCILMGVLWGGGDIDRIYYGTDTHCQGLLLGSALGLVVPPRQLSARVSAAGRRCLDGAGGVALTAIVAMMIFARQSTGFTWRGGLDLVVVLAGVLSVVAAHPASRLARGLAVPPLRWLGTRSYSVYLWHWPILDLTRPHVDVAFGGAPLVAVRLGLIAVAAELSYRFVEQPWRTGRAQAALADFLTRSRRHRRYSWAGLSATLVALAVILASVSAPGPLPGLRATATAAARARITGPTSSLPSGAGPATSTTAPVPSTAVAPSSTPSTIVPSSTVPSSTVPSSTTVPPSTVPPSTVATSGGDGPVPGIPGLRRVPAAGPILAIGDSVMLAAAADLEAAFGSSLTVDAQVGRQVEAGLDRLQSYRAAGRLDGLRAVVVGLGSNGPFSPAQMQRLAAITQGVPEVVLVDVRAPTSWQAESNATIDAAADRPGFRVVHWFAASAAPGVLYPDGVHPDPAGQIIYANLVGQAFQAPVGAGGQLNSGVTR